MKKENQRKSRWVLWVVFFVYLAELIWFFYSQIISQLIKGNPIDVKSKELAVVLILVSVVIGLFFILKKSNKIGRIVISFVVISIVLFCFIAPVFDVYIPVIWKLFSGTQ